MKQSKDLVKAINIDSMLESLIRLNSFKDFCEEYSECFNSNEYLNIIEELKNNYLNLHLSHNIIKQEYLYKEFKTNNVDHKDRWILIGSFLYREEYYFLWYDITDNDILYNYTLDEFIIDLSTNTYSMMDF
jgi:hypothetical protein